MASRLAVGGARVAQPQRRPYCWPTQSAVGHSRYPYTIHLGFGQQHTLSAMHKVRQRPGRRLAPTTHIYIYIHTYRCLYIYIYTYIYIYKYIYICFLTNLMLGQPPPCPLTNLMLGRLRVLLAKVKMDSIMVSWLANGGPRWPSHKAFFEAEPPVPPPTARRLANPSL